MGYYFVRPVGSEGLGAEPPYGYSPEGKFSACWKVGEITADKVPRSHKLLAQLGYDVSTSAKAEQAIMKFVYDKTGAYKIPPDPWFCQTLWQAWYDMFGSELVAGSAKMLDPAAMKSAGASYTPVLGPDKQKPPWMLGIGTCPRPMTGTPPYCKIPLSPTGGCPEGMVGKPPYCTFPNGHLDPLIRPKPTRNLCVSPYIGVWPNCTLPKGEADHMAWERCPKGYVGTPPNCVPGAATKFSCPDGYDPVDDLCVEREPTAPTPCPPDFVMMAGECVPSCKPPSYWNAAEKKCVLTGDAKLPGKERGWSTGAKVAVGAAVAVAVGAVGFAVYARTR
jgi:hypothetical protein